MSITISKRHLYIILIAGVLLIVLTAAGYFVLVNVETFSVRMMELFVLKDNNQPSDYLTPEGMMNLPNRESVKYTELPYEDNENYTTLSIIYESAGKDIHGLLLSPKKEGSLPGVVLLPGAGVDKVSDLPVAKTIALLGYAVFVIDQRGVGETGGSILPLEQDFENYLQGRVADWHLPIIDALVAADVLSTRKNIDSNNILLVGESFGGRIAMIAGAIDGRIKGIVAISSTGLHYQGGKDEKKDRFIRSLDPDTYVASIAPRSLIMIHNAWDKTVPVSSASATFEKAQYPKLFILLNETSCGHGYCTKMLRPLNFSLAAIAGG